MSPGEHESDTEKTVEQVERVREGPPGAVPPPGGADVEEAVVAQHETVRPLPDGSVERDVVRHERRRRMSGDRIAWMLLLLVLLAAGALGAWWYFTQEDTREVPSVQGLMVDEAIARVEAEGLESDVTTQPSEAQEGTVFAQDPSAGTDVDEGSTVRLSVSGGPESTPVPNAVGLPESQARDRLVDAGFQVETRDVFAEDEPGTVVAQEPAAGAETAKGATVTINVSKGSAEVDVPNVVGLPRAEAEAEIDSAKLEANVVEVPSVEPEGTVVAQNPAGGTARQGSTVRINVSNGVLP
jgi:eukaryotic-like serine/threonine-protein kinase